MQTSALRSLLTIPGPFVSVYFDDSHHPEDAEKQLDLKLRELRGELSAQDTPEDSLAAIENSARGRSRTVGRGGRALIAAGGHVVVDEELTEPPATHVARVSALPYLVPLVRYGEPPLRHVVAAVDRAESTIDAFDEHGRRTESETVRGRGHPVHDYLTEITDTVAKAAERTGARLVVLVGGVRARTAVHSALPDSVRAITHEATHESAVEDLVEGAKHRRLADLDARYRTELSRGRGLATEGLAGVATALREADVEVLIVGNPGDSTVFTVDDPGDDPRMVAASERELEAIGTGKGIEKGIERVRERRADEAIPFAAIAADAEIVALTGLLDGGFGAILRHG
ncbi:MAG TPA: hypothetical protein VFG87_12785 [Amycolatopsis sp.]|jgi:hypothetical protein|nr:hypothetical protein [Amycolatopsis sp.]